MNTLSTFYTDSNGREILKRVRDFRPSWKFEQTEPVSGNYYPINSRMFIRDEIAGTQLTLVTDRSQGGSSIIDGSMEIMLHRCTLGDDRLGVGDPLNEKGVDNNGLIVNGNLNLIFNNFENSARLHRELAHQINNQPVIFFYLGSKVRQNKNRWNMFGNITLPDNLHLLTLMKDYDSEEENLLIVRIEHFYEIGEDFVLSQPVTICIRDLFYGAIDVISVKEIGLGANMPVDELDQRLKWNAESKKKSKFTKLDYFKIKKFNLKNVKKKSNSFMFTFQPMQIRTFNVWYA